jgi:membrane-associated protein
MSALMQHLLSTPAWLVLLVVLALPALESSAFLGFIFPGETAVLLGGVAASQGHPPLGAVIGAAIVGAVLGDGVGYLVGRRWGRSILDSTLGRHTKSIHLDRAERALLRGGGWAVFLGRFTAALRVMIPGLAGMAGMPCRRFLVANVAGAVAWRALMATLGYVAGDSWHTVAHDVTGAGVGLTAGVVALYVASRVTRRLLRTRRARAQTHGPGAIRRGLTALGTGWRPSRPASRPL